MFVVLEFGLMGEIDVWQVRKDMPKMLNHLGALIHGSDICLAVTETSTRLEDWFPYDSPPTMEDDKSDHGALLENIQVFSLYSFHSPRVNPNRLLIRPSIHAEKLV